jgi:hypothetical protein
MFCQDVLRGSFCARIVTLTNFYSRHEGTPDARLSRVQESAATIVMSGWRAVCHHARDCPCLRESDWLAQAAGRGLAGACTVGLLR